MCGLCVCACGLCWDELGIVLFTSLLYFPRHLTRPRALAQPRTRTHTRILTAWACCADAFVFHCSLRRCGTVDDGHGVAGGCGAQCVRGLCSVRMWCRMCVPSACVVCVLVRVFCVGVNRVLCSLPLSFSFGNTDTTTRALTQPRTRILTRILTAYAGCADAFVVHCSLRRCGTVDFERGFVGGCVAQGVSALCYVRMWCRSCVPFTCVFCVFVRVVFVEVNWVLRSLPLSFSSRDTDTTTCARTTTHTHPHALTHCLRLLR
jgi:hypothetical protein